MGCPATYSAYRLSRQWCSAPIWWREVGELLSAVLDGQPGENRYASTTSPTNESYDPRWRACCESFADLGKRVGKQPSHVCQSCQRPTVSSGIAMDVVAVLADRLPMAFLKCVAPFQGRVRRRGV